MPCKARLVPVLLVLVLTGACGSSGDEPQAAGQASSGPVGVTTPSPEYLEVVGPTPTLAPASPPKPPPPESNVVTPSQLVIPAIGVKAPVLKLGLNDSGAQKVPPGVDKVSWFKYGAKPGQPGNAVFAGHTWSEGQAVFDHLGKLNPGDLVKVTGQNDTTVSGRVARVNRHVEPSLPQTKVARIYRETGPPGLVLITCGDFSNGDYHSRIVVYVEIK